MFIMFRVFLFHELEAAVISSVCSGDHHYPNSNTMHVYFASTYMRTQRKYVNCCFLLEPPSPYNSFHCFSSLIIEPSAAKLAATCTIWQCKIHQICVGARIFKCTCIYKISCVAKDGLTWFFACLTSSIFNGLRIGASSAFSPVVFEGSDGFSRASAFFLSWEYVQMLSS